MTLANLISSILSLSLLVLVFVLGLRAKFDEVTYLFRNPGLLCRSILAMNILLVCIAVAASVLLNLDPAIKIALVTLAVSPVPPLLPNKQMGAGGTSHYAIGLLVAASVVSVVLVPLSIEAIEHFFPFDLYIAPGKVFSVVAMSIFVPLILGMLVGRLAPSVASRIAGPLSSIAMALLIVAIIPVLIKAWPDLSRLFGDGVVLSLVLFTVVGLALGHLLGGPEPANRTALALASSTRHPAVAIAIATLNFPDVPGVPALILYHLVIGGIVSTLYLRWRRGTTQPPIASSHAGGKG
ncbi:Na+-dependent transporter [Mesorhizobium sp. M2E.F.Ca.ET.209.01.1.1]|uniref:Na+-dependent transporter n=1 Tax=Mesorhizobium sp. M2E.F.Ca.ET.209.01.1.1 TaxID=2500526 RepID=UPI000FDA6458|nr:Na+-dependent transporter [Mesorhizobium sp. M2E.F.Ca.ET.209.01.1.1]TGS09654.1 Na+-dependent transporter [Mesorhizobium sp. M2E.F.Ca.ET.209.01.1.1]